MTAPAAAGAIVYDLSEALGVGTGRLKYYGIARVAVEIGLELAKLDAGIRFAIFSPGHGRFFEITPRLDAAAYGGVDFGLPFGQGPSHVRTFNHAPRRPAVVLGDVFLDLARACVRLVNRRRWRRAGLSMRALSLDGAVLVSAARPKLMVDMLAALERRGERVRFAPLLHDMIPLHDHTAGRAKRFPRNFLADNLYVIARASHVMANSHFTAHDIRRFIAAGELPPIARLTATQLAHECRAAPDAPHLSAPDAPYLLCVGAQTGRKNIEIVIEALLRLAAEGAATPRLVLAGAIRKSVSAYLASPRFNAIRARIVTVANPGQADLVRLYQGASALILPSRIEGWGLPAAEALWFGVPALCSTAPVLREVCGAAAFYFDPDRPDELAQLIVRIMAGDRPPRAQALRSWTDVAHDVRAVAQQERAEAAW